MKFYSQKYLYLFVLLEHLSYEIQSKQTIILSIIPKSFLGAIFLRFSRKHKVERNLFLARIIIAPLITLSNDHGHFPRELFSLSIFLLSLSKSLISMRNIIRKILIFRSLINLLPKLLILLSIIQFIESLLVDSGLNT